MREKELFIKDMCTLKESRGSSDTNPIQQCCMRMYVKTQVTKPYEKPTPLVEQSTITIYGKNISSPGLG